MLPFQKYAINLCYSFIFLTTTYCLEIKPEPAPIRDGIQITIDAANYKNTQELVYYNETVLPNNSKNEIIIKNFLNTSNNISFAILQIHSFEYNVTLSYNKSMERNYNENGTNLGLTLYPNDYKSANGQAIVYVHNFNYFTSINVSVVLMIYNQTTPVPGGCNMEYSVRDAPILLVKSIEQFMYVDTPLAADNSAADDRILCNASLSYIGYHLFLPRNDYSCRTYFDGIKSMLTSDLAQKNGQLGTPWIDLPNRRSYISVPGTGVIFSTIVYGKNGRAAYVPAYTISCTPQFWETGCNIFRSPEFGVLSGVLIFVGILRAYFGSYFMLLGVFIDSFIFGLFMTFFVVYYGFPNTKLTVGAERTTLIAVGFAISIIFTFIWHSMLVPRKLIEVCSNIIVGYLLASLTLFIADDVEYKSSGYWYEMIFLAMILLTLILFPPCYNVSGIVLSATWGAFAIVQGILFLTGPHLSFIIINSIRYVTIKDYRYAHTTPQLNPEDWCYIALWFTLLLTAIVFQMKILNKPSDEYSEDRYLVYAADEEHTPLISRWTHGSDDVFESPTTNERFLANYRSTISSRNSL